MVRPTAVVRAGPGGEGTGGSVPCDGWAGASVRSVTLDLTSVTLLGPGPLAPIQPLCLPLKPTVGTQTLAHPHPALIHAIISVIERFARAYLQAAALPRWLRRSSPWRAFVCAWLGCISRVGQ